jgi:hypothetical protein
MKTLFDWTILVLGVAVVVLVLRHPKKISKRAPTPMDTRRLSFAIVDRDQARVQPYPYLYVNADGSARELHPNERNYLETPFDRFDGGRPSIKSSYSSKNGWGEITGFLERSKLPQGTQIHPAPGEDPSKPLTVKDQIQFLRDKGWEIIENSDGTFTAKKPNR